MENFRRRSRYAVVFIGLIFAFCLITVLNINTGSVHISVPDIFKIIFTKSGDATAYNIIWKIRFPRILMAAILGGGLSLSGFLLQTFFSNAFPMFMMNSLKDLCVKEELSMQVCK